MFEFSTTINLVATSALTGLIWLIQLVHYPLFEKVGETTFDDYHKAHVKKIGPLVISLMGIEGVSAVLLVALAPSQDLRAFAILGLLLAVLIWVVTARLQVPLHKKLSRGFDKESINSLVLSNWWRTALWTLRLVVVVGILLNKLDA